LLLLSDRENQVRKRIVLRKAALFYDVPIPVPATQDLPLSAYNLFFGFPVFVPVPTRFIPFKVK
jgi:hypothetical protein